MKTENSAMNRKVQVTIVQDKLELRVVYLKQIIAKVEIQDEGTGISKKKFPKLFQCGHLPGNAPNEISNFGIGFYFARELLRIRQCTDHSGKQRSKKHPLFFQIPISINQNLF